MTRFQAEVARGQRFEFGKNWQRFLSVLDDERILEAERSLKNVLGGDTLRGKTFLDIGSGSGLFSMAALRLGAARVHSLDYDQESVACALELKRRYLPGAPNWTIERGNVLDSDYLHGLGQWDVVYSWGVLHHTGDMWAALNNVAALVRNDGVLFISIYNDQGLWSKYWQRIKILYNSGHLGKWFILGAFIPYFALRLFAADILRRRNPISSYREYKKARGMSMLHDWFDWLGGYPFEVAKPEDIFRFYHERGFSLEYLRTCAGGLGCNEFVLRK